MQDKELFQRILGLELLWLQPTIGGSQNRRGTV